MAKIACSYRIEASVLPKIDAVLTYLQDRYDYAAELSMTKPRKASRADAVEFAVNAIYDSLINKEGEYVFLCNECMDEVNIVRMIDKT